MRRMLREKFEYDKIDNFPAYMLDYVVNGERGDLEEREIDAFEDWMDQNGYVSINPVSDEEWSEDFCSHPAFGPACDCVPVYAERGETGDRSGKSRMIKENASYRGATVAKVKRDLSRKLKRAGFKYIREVMGLGGSGDHIEMWSKNGEVVDVILRGQSGDPSHIEAILLHTGDKDREYIDAYGNAEAAVDSAVEWLVNKMEKKNESRQRRGRMLRESNDVYEIYAVYLDEPGMTSVEDRAEDYYYDTVEEAKRAARDLVSSCDKPVAVEIYRSERSDDGEVDENSAEIVYSIANKPKNIIDGLRKKSGVDFEFDEYLEI